MISGICLQMVRGEDRKRFMKALLVTWICLQRRSKCLSGSSIWSTNRTLRLLMIRCQVYLWRREYPISQRNLWSWLQDRIIQSLYKSITLSLVRRLLETKIDFLWLTTELRLKMNCLISSILQVQSKRRLGYRARQTYRQLKMICWAAQLPNVMTTIHTLRPQACKNKVA